MNEQATSKNLFDLGSKQLATENSPDVTQIIEMINPNTHVLITRCLKGRNVACVRSNEIAARFVREAVMKKSYTNLS